jgi:hypothetical protein
VNAAWGKEERIRPLKSLSHVARRAVEMATDGLSDNKHAAEFRVNSAQRDPQFRTEVLGSAQT